MSTDLNQLHFKDVKRIKIPIPTGSTSSADLKDVYKIKNSQGVVIWRRLFTQFDVTYSSTTDIYIPSTQTYRIGITGAQGGGACCYSGSGNSIKIICTGGYGGYMCVKAKIKAGTYRFISGIGGKSTNTTWITGGGWWYGEDGQTTSFGGIDGHSFFMIANSGSHAGALDDALHHYPFDQSFYGSGGTTSVNQYVIPQGISNISVIQQQIGQNGFKVSKSSSQTWEPEIQTSSVNGSIHIWSVKEDN